MGLIPALGRSPGVGNGNPLQYSCLKIPRTEKPGRLQSVGPQRPSVWTCTHILLSRLRLKRWVGGGRQPLNLWTYRRYARRRLIFSLCRVYCSLRSSTQRTDEQTLKKTLLSTHTHTHTHTHGIPPHTQQQMVRAESESNFRRSDPRGGLWQAGGQGLERGEGWVKMFKRTKKREDDNC